ncbi:MAG: hypothetical protein JWM91_1086 [Rhodospirillales bacterium]|nr:hypothetical protein [Rhodospirillales bacterium]
MWPDYTAFGVSLGNNYRYFGKYAPEWAVATQLFTQAAKEGVGWLDANSPEKGNAENLNLRLLSETGLTGFVISAFFFIRRIFRGLARDSFRGSGFWIRSSVLRHEPAAAACGKQPFAHPNATEGNIAAPSTV